MRTLATVPITVAFSVLSVFATIVCATRTRPSSLPAALVSPGVCAVSYNEITKTSAPTGASIATVDVPPAIAGLFANVTGPGAAPSGFTSTTTLSADGDTKCGGREERGARSGQRSVKLTGERAVASACCAPGTMRAPPPQPLARNASAAAANDPRAVT